MKAALVALTVTLAAYFAAPQDPFPAPEDKFPQTFPGSTKEPGGGLGRYPRDRASAASLYAGATAWYDFNDLADLGSDRSGNANDLTETNTPLAAGGALGYSAFFDVDSNQSGSVVDAAGLEPGDGDFAVAGWFIPTDIAAVGYGIISKSASGTNNLSWALYRVGGTVTWLISSDGAVSGRTLLTCRTGGTALAAGVRYFIVARYDMSADTMYCDVNDGNAEVSTAHDGGAFNSNAPVRVGGYSDNVGRGDGSFGPFYYYIGVDDVPATLVNSDKGKLCEDLTAAEQTNLVACWNMTEDGGPYADSINSYDLTANNSPTRSNGLVEQVSSLSGMAYDAPNKDHTGHLESSATIAEADFDESQDFTFAFWLNYRTFVTGGNFVMQNGDEVATRNWAFTRDAGTRISCRFYNDGGSTAAVYVAGSPVGEWHHITCTYDSSDQKARVYLDGTVQAEGTALGAGSQVNGYKIRIDDRGTANDVGFEGSLDDVVIFPAGTLKDTTWMSDVYNAGAGTFYAAIMDFFFEYPIFPWSKPPEIRRVS